jgi:hypothetical protein
MIDSRLPLSIRSVPEGFAIIFADGSEHLLIRAVDRCTGRQLPMDEALELAKEIARALVSEWGPFRSAARADPDGPSPVSAKPGPSIPGRMLGP